MGLATTEPPKVNRGIAGHVMRFSCVFLCTLDTFLVYLKFSDLYFTPSKKDLPLKI